MHQMAYPTYYDTQPYGGARSEPLYHQRPAEHISLPDTVPSLQAIAHSQTGSSASSTSLYHPVLTECRGASDAMPAPHAQLAQLRAQLQEEEAAADKLRHKLLSKRLLSKPLQSRHMQFDGPLMPPGHVPPGHAPPGHAPPGHVPPGNALLGHELAGHAPPGSAPAACRGILPHSVGPGPASWKPSSGSEDVGARHRAVAERCRWLYLKGRLEGFEVLCPESVFPLSVLSDAPRSAAASGSRERPNSSRTLQVRILKAKNLRNRDTGPFGDVSDPYVVVCLGKQKHQTPTINDNLNPVWDLNNRFVFDVSEKDHTLEIEVMNENVLRSDSLGRTSVSLESLEPGRWHTRQDHLQDGHKGELEFEVLLSSGDTQDEAPQSDAVQQPINEGETQEELDRLYRELHRRLESNASTPTTKRMDDEVLGVTHPSGPSPTMALTRPKEGHVAAACSPSESDLNSASISSAHHSRERSEAPSVPLAVKI